MRSALETYLARLRSELRRRGLIDERVVEESREHLADLTERALKTGMSLPAAEHQAISEFGTPELVAAHFANQRFQIRNRVSLVVAVVLGLGIAYVDSRPTWDDTGVTAFSMFLAAGVLGFIAPQRPWLWALAVGIWIPLAALLRSPSLGSVVMLVVLAFPLAGAYAGLAVRRTLQTSEDGQSGFHDRQSFAIALKTKRGWVDPQLLEIASDPDARLVPYLERIAPRPLGPLGKLESLTLIEESTRKRTYRAVFGTEAPIICTVVLAPDGRALRVSWSRQRAERPTI